MKKVLIILLAIITLLAVAYFGFFKYRQIQANNFLIPSNAESVVKINVDELYKTIAISYLKHPKQYAGSEKKDLKKRIEDLHMGLEIPANFYLYSLKGNQGNYFTKLKINDNIAFSRFITRYFKQIKKDSKTKNTFAQLPDSTLSIVFSSTEVAIGYHPAKSNLRSVLTAILANQNAIKFKDSQFGALSSLPDHIAFKCQESLATFNFYDGKLKFNSEFTSDQILPFEKPQHRKLNPNSSLSMWLNADFKIDKRSAVSSAKQRFLSFYKGYMDIEWLKTTNKKDTVVSFEFNDDFERIEKKQVIDRKIPQLYINMDADARAVTKYLVDSNLVDLSTGRISAATIPLYQIYFNSNGDQVQFNTVNKAAFNIKKVPAEDFFHLHIDFEKLLKDASLPILTDKLLALKKLESKGRKIGTNQIKFETVVEFQNVEANSLIQLIKMYQKLKSTPIQINFGSLIPKH